MQNSRSIKDLLQVLLDNPNHLIGRGLCSSVFTLESGRYISYYEMNILHQYIKEHKPYNLYRIFGKYAGIGYYWEPGKIKPRIRWIKRHIKKNS